MHRFPVARRLGTGKARAVKYLVVSVLSLAVAQAVLFLLFGVLGWTARSANVTAFVVGAIPSYHLNRAWTWAKRGRSHLLFEVLPFWAIALFGLTVSTLAAEAGEQWATTMTSSRVQQGFIVSAASLATCGVVWVTRFIAFDRLLFVVQTTRQSGITAVSAVAEAPERRPPPPRRPRG